MSEKDRSVVSSGASNGSQKKEGNVAESKIRTAGQRASQAALNRGSERKKENNVAESKAFDPKDYSAVKTRIEALQKVDADLYKNLSVREWYSIRQAADIIGQSQVWLRRQIVQKGRFADRVKKVRITNSETGNDILAWRLHISLIQERMLYVASELRRKEQLRENPRANYSSSRRYQPKSLMEQIKSASPEELEELRKLLNGNS